MLLAYLYQLKHEAKTKKKRNKGKEFILDRKNWAAAKYPSPTVTFVASGYGFKAVELGKIACTT